MSDGWVRITGWDRECGTGGVVVGAASLVLPVVLVITVCVVGEERDRGGG